MPANGATMEDKGILIALLIYIVGMCGLSAGGAALFVSHQYKSELANKTSQLEAFRAALPGAIERTCYECANFDTNLAEAIPEPSR
jgi:hypothetical protein